VVVGGDKLEAVCQTASGYWRHTALAAFRLCLSSISNENGKLTCAFQAAPRGSYHDSCSGIVVKDGVVYAQCRTREGAYVSASSSVECRGEIQNDDGRLQCVRVPPGSYFATCKNIVVGQASLTATCQTASGQWQQTTLGGYRSCYGDIRNENGNLTCN
jgi:hypothetical protein